MKLIKFLFIQLLFIATLFVSCKPSEEPEDYGTAKHSVLLYMIASNNLSPYLSDNISEVVDNYSSDLYKGNNVIIYHKTRTEAKLYKVTNNKSLKLIKSYDLHNAATPEVVSLVIEDFKRLFPADSYGMLFSGHASGWLPDTFFGHANSSMSQRSEVGAEVDDIQNHPLYHLIRKPFEPVTRAYGDDNKSYLEFYEIASSLKDKEFEYIIFDACYMSSIEVAYEFRNKANWLLAAPTEVLGAGMNYTRMMLHLLDSRDSLDMRLTRVAEDFTKKYSDVTISLLDLTKMESFANEYKRVMAAIPDKTGNCTPYNVQHYDNYSRYVYPGGDRVIFDLVAYVDKIGGEENAKIISDMLSKLVKYKFATPVFLHIPMTDFSGVSTYIPFEYYNLVTPKYKNTNWYKDILQ